MIKDLKSGEKGNAPFYCHRVTESTTKTGKLFQSVTLRDSSGSINAKVWDVERNGVKEGEYYAVQYSVQEYAGSLQLIIESIAVLDKESINPADFYPTSKYNVNKMFKDIVTTLSTVQNEWLQKLLMQFFDNKELVKLYENASAAVDVHHAFVGGLVQHTRAILKMAVTAAGLYDGVDKDLLLTAAFFHDVGKLKEISAFPENKFTAFGVLIGHVTLSTLAVEHWCESIDGFPADLKIKLMHCILAHHGELEWGSPVKPALKEAIILSMLDNLDAKIGIYEETLEKGGGRSFQLGTTVLDEEGMLCIAQDLY